jgi:hypothetical protein
MGLVECINVAFPGHLFRFFPEGAAKHEDYVRTLDELSSVSASRNDSSST